VCIKLSPSHEKYYKYFSNDDIFQLSFAKRNNFDVSDNLFQLSLGERGVQQATRRPGAGNDATEPQAHEGDSAAQSQCRDLWITTFYF
jgi:hypothetical protein